MLRAATGRCTPMFCGMYATMPRVTHAVRTRSASVIDSSEYFYDTTFPRSGNEKLEHRRTFRGLSEKRFLPLSTLSEAEIIPHRRYDVKCICKFGFSRLSDAVGAACEREFVPADGMSCLSHFESLSREPVFPPSPRFSEVSNARYPCRIT